MAVRYVEIGQYPDVRREVRGNLSEILAAAANPGTYAAPEDVTGCFLEMGTNGKWYGDLGTMPKATADALYASGALANLAAGATYRDTSGAQHTYSAGVGWVNMAMEGDLSARAPSRTDNSSRGYAVGAVWKYGSDLYVCKDSSATDATWGKLRNPAILPGDVAPSKVSCIGGTVRCVTGYTGNAIDISVVIAATPTAASIGLLANGELDSDAVAKMYGRADADTYITVTKIYDQSGNGRHFINPSEWSTPVSGFNPPRLDWSVQQGRWIITGFTQYSPSASGSALANESATFTGNNYSMLCIGETSNAASKPQFMCVGSYRTGAGSYSALQVTGSAWGQLADVRNPGGPTKWGATILCPTVNPSVLFQTCNATSRLWRCNERASSYTSEVPGSTAYTGAWICDDGVTGSTPTDGIRGCVWGFFSSALTSDEMTRITRGAYLVYGIIPQRRNKLILVGDSRIEGASTNNWRTIAIALAEALGASAPLIYSMGLGGQQQTSMLTQQLPVAVGLKEDGHYVKVVSLSAINDFLVGNATPEQALSNTKANAAYVISAGLEFYAFSELSTTNVTNNANVKVPQYRSLILMDNSWLSGLIDTSKSNFALSPSNASAYPDGVHPSEALYMALADMISKEVI